LTSYKLCLFAYRRDFLGSKITAGNEDNAGKVDVRKLSGKVSDCIKETREEYGRYFGICGSYHHLKACICKICPSYSGGAGMFCSRNKNRKPGKKEGCLCESCELFRKFRFEGDYFCREEEKPEFSKRPGISLNNYKNNSSSIGKTRFCIVEKLENGDK
jgi:hypothetical protein